METENIQEIEAAIREYKRQAYKRWEEKHRNDPEVKQKRSEYQRRYYAKNKDKIIAYCKEWKKNNPDKVKMYEYHTAVNWLKKQEALKAQEEA